MPVNNSWSEYAGGHPRFTEWLQRLDEICVRFINVDFAHLVEAADFDPHEAFFQMAVTPEQFLREMVIPYLKNEYGADFLEENLYDQVCWGERSKEDHGEAEDQAR